MRNACLGLVLLLATPLVANGTVIDDFDAGITPWSPTLQYGVVAKCRAVPGTGTRTTGALQVDYALEGGDADLSGIRRVGFFIWSMGPKRGSVCFDNLRVSGAGAQLRVSAQGFNAAAVPNCPRRSGRRCWRPLRITGYGSVSKWARWSGG